METDGRGLHPGVNGRQTAEEEEEDTIIVG